MKLWATKWRAKWNRKLCEPSLTHTRTHTILTLLVSYTHSIQQGNVFVWDLSHHAGCLKEGLKNNREGVLLITWDRETGWERERGTDRQTDRERGRSSRPHQRYISVSWAEHFQHHLHLLWRAVAPQIILILTFHLQHTCIDVGPGAQTQVLSLNTRTAKKKSPYRVLQRPLSVVIKQMYKGF